MGDITFTSTFRNKNHEIAEFVFEAMRKFGFKPYNIEYGNTYFIFTGDDDSIVHFRVKGVWKHWKFGMWIRSDYLDEEHLKEEKEKNPAYKQGNKVVRIFAQYDTCIDKFKPSASSLVVEYEAIEWKEIIERNWSYELKNMLRMMRRHPFMCYCEFCGEYAGYWSGSFIWTFIKHESYTIRQSIKKAIVLGLCYPYTKLKCFLAKRDRCIHDIKLYDFEKDNPGWSTDYRYGVEITFAAEATEEDEVAWLNRWFKKRKYGKYGCFDYAVEVQDFNKVGREEAYTYTDF